MSEARFRTRRIRVTDPGCGFRSGTHALDEYFRRHAFPNDQIGVGLAYVLDSPVENQIEMVPPVCGFYTLSMAAVSADDASAVLATRLPRYPMPVVLIGRLAVDERFRGRRLGEQLLLDALARVVDAADVIGCLGVIVDAKDAAAQSFYEKYGFVCLHAATWPQRMFLPIHVIRRALSES